MDLIKCPWHPTNRNKVKCKRENYLRKLICCDFPSSFSANISARIFLSPSFGLVWKQESAVQVTGLLCKKGRICISYLKLWKSDSFLKPKSLSKNKLVLSYSIYEFIAQIRLKVHLCRGDISRVEWGKGQFEWMLTSWLDLEGLNYAMPPNIQFTDLSL